MIKFRAWNSETKEIEVFETYEEISELFLALSADDGFYSIMQSTGLKDKNGKEIFEGDIITNGIDIVDVRNHETLGFYTMVNGREVFFRHGTSIEEFEEDIEGFTEIAEIIGNIYENPELLEAKDE